VDLTDDNSILVDFSNGQTRKYSASQLLELIPLALVLREDED
jgi:hypothetical protein